ncbi:hypothetical protein H4219_001310 [Mycoemilia scoparia]|uniref:Uncharacterized protein n=1 Tax=Mycoemilia scoparia TaxID=417184 RepID=A0A9W8A6B3_9FUNG|nr:hypothetical protein H4219_001310 [Mycoemilia scoparia]
MSYPPNDAYGSSSNSPQRQPNQQQRPPQLREHRSDPYERHYAPTNTGNQYQNYEYEHQPAPQHGRQGQYHQQQHHDYYLPRANSSYTQHSGDHGPSGQYGSQQDSQSIRSTDRYYRQERQQAMPLGHPPPYATRQREYSDASSTAPLVSRQGGGPYAQSRSYQDSNASIDNYSYMPSEPRNPQISKYPSHPGQRQGMKSSGYPGGVKSAAVAGAAAGAIAGSKQMDVADAKRNSLMDPVETDNPNVLALSLPPGVKPSQEVSAVTIPVSQAPQKPYPYSSASPQSPSRNQDGNYPMPPSLSKTGSAGYSTASQRHQQHSTPKYEPGTMKAYQYVNSQNVPPILPPTYAPPPQIMISPSGNVKRHKSISDRYAGGNSGGECGCGECCSSFCGGCCTCCGKCACSCCGCLCCPIIMVLVVILICVGIALALYFNRDKIFHKT